MSISEKKVNKFKKLNLDLPEFHEGMTVDEFNELFVKASLKAYKKAKKIFARQADIAFQNGYDIGNSEGYQKGLSASRINNLRTGDIWRDNEFKW